MEDFRNCVWACPAPSHPWHSFINNVPAHLTVASYLNSPRAAKSVFDSIKRSVRIRLVGPVVATETNGFCALTVRVFPVDGHLPAWWPVNAHVSFAYRYNHPYEDGDVEALENALTRVPRTAELVVLRSAAASGHFHDWRILDSKSVGEL